MMKNGLFKRIVSALLTLCIIVGLAPMSVFESAAETRTSVTRVASYSDLTGTIQNLAQVKNERFDASTYITSGTNATGATVVSGGSYYIVNMDYNGTTALTTGRMLDLTQDFTEEGMLNYVNVTVNNTNAGNSIISGAEPDMAIKIVASTNHEPPRCVMYPVEGLGFGAAGLNGATTFPDTMKLARGTPTNYALNAYYSSTYDGLMFVNYQNINDGTGWNWYVLEYFPSIDNFMLQYYGKPSGGSADKPTNFFQLYRLADHVSELYKAIKAVEGYAHGNADGKFNSAAYKEFYDLLTACIDSYNTNNVIKTIDEQADLKLELDGDAKELLAAASKLDMTMESKERYIDLPIEILDFRADGALFEWDRYVDNRFGLRTTATGAKSTPTTLGSKSNVYTGMTEANLINGQLIYKQGTVEFIAGVLQDVNTDAEESSIYYWAGTDKSDGANLEIFNKALSLKNSGAKKGTLADTLTRTDTKANGGYITWNQITTFCDLAYYMLNNLWRPVKSGDYLDTTNSLGYNMTIPEVKRLRLFLDEDGNYTIDASNRMTYDGFYAYSDSTFYPNDVMSLDARFRPADNLGFESPDSGLEDTDQGEYLSKYLYDSADTNFHFSMHAEGSFVYHRDDNLFFEFIGDDDVYFYINGQIALDLGGSHDALGDRLYLNSKAAEWGLVDGNVYSFDMFYIERHTTASNLKFSTNIELVEKTQTEKSMYAETSGNSNTVDSQTGMGKELMDDALVRDGDIIAYSFDLANTRDIPVYNIAFKDSTLGTNISPTAATLCNTSLTGGVQTKITDIELYYQCYDDENGEFYTGYPTTKTVTEMTALIDAANAGTGSFIGMSSYRVSISNATELKNMLKKGVPAYCKLLVYGFKRVAQESVPEYTNTVNSTCYYNLKGTGATTTGADDIAITGSASCRYRVTAQPPTADPVEIVLDYGKAVEIPVETVRGNIQTDALTSVTGFAGIVTSGSHGAVLTYLDAASLLCASKGKTYEGKQGTFTRIASGLTYQPTEFMDSVETVYLVYNLTATNSDYKYVLIELKLVPATSVYYETDFSDSAFNNINGDEDYFDTDNAFYADFTNNELDKLRYEKAVYGGKNYDLASNWNALPIDEGIPAYSTPKIANGELSVDFLADNPDRNWIWVQANGDLHTGFSLNYRPHSSHVVQIRAKFHDLVATEGKTPFAAVSYFTGVDRWEGVAADYGDPAKEKLYSMDHHYFTADELKAFNDGEYVTFTFDVKGIDSDEHTLLTNLRFTFGNVECDDASSVLGGFTIDYVYVGPKDNAPAREDLLFDFTNDDNANNRYSTHNYNGQKFDVSSAWQSAASGRLQSIAVDQNEQALKLTAAKSLSDSTPPTFAFATKSALSYLPANAEVLQLRFKMENFVKGSWTDNGTVKNPDISISMSYTVDSATSWVDATDAKKFSAQYISSGEYFVLELDLKDAFKTAEKINTIRFYVTGVESDPNSNPGVMYVDYIYIGKKADAPAADALDEYLFFDFGNTEADRKRYADNPAYGGFIFDVENWATGASTGTRAFTMDYEEGTVAVAVADRDSDYGPYFATTNVTGSYPWSANAAYAPLSFKIKANSEISVRFKVSGCEIASGKSSTVGLRIHYTDSSGTKKYLDNTSVGYTFTEDVYTSATIGLSTIFTGSETINSVGVRFGGLDGTNNGKVTIDYIYIGPEGMMPTNEEPSDYLYFDFDNSEADRDRYANTSVYNANNYDDPSKVSTHFTQPAVIKELRINNATGHLQIVGDVLSEGAWPGYYTNLKKALSFKTADADYFEMRFKLNNFVRGTQNASTKTPYFTFGCFGKIGDNATIVLEAITYGLDHLSDGEYITIKKDIPETNAFHTLESIEGLRFYFGGIESDLSTFDELGVISIDYVFLGKKADVEKAKTEAVVNTWQTVSDSENEYQDQSDIASKSTCEQTTTDLATTATEAEVLESLGVTNVLGANHAQRNEYYGLTNGLSKYTNGTISTVSHRGSFRTSSENSYLAVIDALKLGLDNVEIDLQMTSDGVLVLCHDERIDRTMNKDGQNIYVSSLTWDELKDYPLEVGNGPSDTLFYTLTDDDAALLNSISNYATLYGEAASAGGYHYTARFDALLDLLKAKAPNAMLTLDKVNTQEKFVAIYKLLNDKGMVGQAMFSLNTSLLASFDTWAAAADSACGLNAGTAKSTAIVRYSVGLDTGTVENVQTQLTNGINVKVLEYTYNESQAVQAEEYLTSTLLPFLKTKSIKFYPSAIGPSWAGGRDDVETTWLHYLRMGATAIMTDRGEEMAGFIAYYNGKARSTSELIEAEHFQNYNYNNAKFYMKEAADLNNNKLVNEMHAGDWLQYNKITFTGSETKLYVSAKGIGGGTLKFYVDSMQEDHCFAVVNFASSESTYTQTVTMLNKVAKGNHTVYVKADGANAQALVSFDCFSCASFTNSNYLYFGFGNSTADKNRYSSNSAYGGYNFDTYDTANSKVYWATNTVVATSDEPDRKLFSIDNAKGVAVVDASSAPNGTEIDPTKTDGSTRPIYGTQFMTTNTYGIFTWRNNDEYAPLQYVPSKSDFLTVRFMLTGCEDSGNNELEFQFWYTDNRTDKNVLSYTATRADYAFVQNEYIVVTMALPDAFTKDSVITSIGLRFKGAKSVSDGKITIDYIYVGPMAEQQTDHLLIDFEDAPYSDIAYGGKNYNLASSWARTGTRSTTPVIVDGALKFAVNTTCDAIYHRMTSVNSMRYVPGPDDYIQVRYKVENASPYVKESGETTIPGLNIYWSQDAYSRTTNGVGRSNNTSTGLELKSTDWQTATIRMDTTHNSAYYRDSEVISTLCIMFNNVAVPTDANNPTTFYIDYIYIGPIDKAPDNQTNAALLFDFTNSEADQLRYADEKYGNINFDEAITEGDPTTNHWTKYASVSNSASSIVIDNEAGTIALTAKPSKNHVWTETSKSGTAYDNPLKFAASDAKYCQIRFKCQNFTQYGTTTPAITFYPGFAGGTNVSAGTSETFDKNYLSNGTYLTLTFALPTENYSAHDYLTNVRIQLTNASCTAANPGIFTIDYIYIGTLYTAPAADDNRSAYFDFTDNSSDRERYSQRIYGNVNYDDESVKHWYESTHESNGAGTTVLVDNSTGTLTVNAKSTVSYAWAQPIETPTTSTTDLDAPLNLPVESVQYCQIRFKCENFKQYNSTTPFIAFYPRFDDWSDIQGGNYRAHKTFDKAYLSNGEYLTLTFALPTNFYSAYQTLKNFRIQLTNASCTADNPGKFIIDYIYVGTKENLPTDEFVTYGYDSSYESDSRLSNGSSLFVEGRGVALMNSNKSINYAGAKAFSESSFTFTGTGFDIISRTGPEQGQLRVVIYDSEGDCVKVAQVLNKSDVGTELMQVPVVSVELENHGTYHVKIFVAEPYTNTSLPMLNRGNEFYFDAVRIYNPINTEANTADASTAYAIYQKHGEADPGYIELRSKLISEGFGNISGSAVYIDAKIDTDYLKDKTAMDQYTYAGPNNEVYLENGKAIAFKLSVTGMIPASIDIGAKSVNGAPVKLVTKVSTTAPTAVPTATDIANGIDIESSTAQYYPLKVIPSAWKTSGSTQYVYVTIYNAGSGLLSITDIKSAYDSAKTSAARTVKCSVDREMLDELNICYAHEYAYTINVEEHILACTACGYGYAEKHTFTDGVCICGAEEGKVPLLDEALTFDMVVTAGAEMSTGYSFMADCVANYESFYLEVSKAVAGGDPVVTVFNAEDFAIALHPTTGQPLMYTVSYRGISAKEMGDEFTTTLYALDSDGRLHYGPTQTSSVKSTLLEKFNAQNATDELKRMAIDMLNYGAAAQTLFGYGTEKLVTADLTEEQRSYATAEIPEATDISASSGEGVAITANVTVGSKVELGLSIFKAGLSDPETVRCEIRDAEGNLIAEPAVANAMNMMFSAGYSEVGAREMRKPITATFYMGDEAISQTITWSVESYVAQVRANSNSTESDIAMVNSMLTYGDSVGEYLTSVGQ